MRRSFIKIYQVLGELQWKICIHHLLNQLNVILVAATFLKHSSGALAYVVIFYFLYQLCHC